jgi:O-acetyl-ADP-ribose deacetylase (regulator of RNase III)
VITPGIEYEVGDACRPKVAGMIVIAHCCNNRGQWGAGFVLALSKRWSRPESEYRGLATRFGADIPLGLVQYVSVGPGVMVANIIAQDNRRPRAIPLVYEALLKGFKDLAGHALSLRASVQMPRIGCGIAGGQWEKVEPLIEATLCKAGVPVTVYDLPIAIARTQAERVA